MEKERSSAGFWYISNAGIVLETPETAIGIDCFCKDPSGIYRDTSDKVRQLLLKQIEKRRIQMLLFTHEHGDHFYPDDVKAAAELNPEITIIAGEVTASMAKKAGIAKRNLTVISDVDDQELCIRVGRHLSVSAFQSTHDGTEYQKVQNLVFLIQYQGRGLVITGDAEGRQSLFERIAKWNSKPDWLLVPFPFVGKNSIRKRIAAVLSPQRIFVLHQPLEEKDDQRWAEHTKRICRHASDSLPEPVFPEKPGSWHPL